MTKVVGEVDLYISRMFIKANHKELLPRWARFVKGVINTPDLTPTLSRGDRLGCRAASSPSPWGGGDVPIPDSSERAMPEPGVEGAEHEHGGDARRF